MASLETILIATDFSDCSLRALDYARVFSDRFGSSLHLLHVVAEPLHELWACYSPGDAFVDLAEKLERDARHQMRLLVRADERAARRVVIAAVWGDPVQEILKYAREHAVDLIVCGTHGRHGLDRVAMGSVAERIVRLAPCPVLTVRGTELANASGERAASSDAAS